ncbi:MAG TPA: hypothetical protein VLA83_03210 [Candidatus Binatia bacterium]|nr:hypothetical protein [Candidatus Binatia bacterium]
MDLGTTQLFNDLANHWAAYVGQLTVIGSVSMAILQTVKDLLPIRQWFQEFYLDGWVEAGAAEARERFKKDISVTRAEADLLVLAVDGDKGAFYDLQIEQLCGQYTAAIQMVLEFPSKHLDLLAVTASKAESTDIDLVLAGPPTPPTQEFLDARNRVTHQCQRAIDALQITAGFRWKWILQIASIVISGSLAWAAMTYKQGAVSPSVVSVISSAILAGFLAPVAKDLLAIVQKARGQ